MTFCKSKQIIASVLLFDFLSFSLFSRVSVLSFWWPSYFSWSGLVILLASLWVSYSIRWSHLSFFWNIESYVNIEDITINMRLPISPHFQNAFKHTDCTSLWGLNLQQDILLMKTLYSNAKASSEKIQYALLRKFFHHLKFSVLCVDPSCP